MPAKFKHDFRERERSEEGICSYCRLILTEEDGNKDNFYRVNYCGILMAFHKTCVENYRRRVETFVAKRNEEARWAESA